MGLDFDDPTSGGLIDGATAKLDTNPECHEEIRTRYAIFRCLESKASVWAEKAKRNIAVRDGPLKARSRSEAPAPFERPPVMTLPDNRLQNHGRPFCEKSSSPDGIPPK
jgi:hypothetical protein